MPDQAAPNRYFTGAPIRLLRPGPDGQQLHLLCPTGQHDYLTLPANHADADRFRDPRTEITCVHPPSPDHTAPVVQLYTITTVYTDHDGRYEHSAVTVAIGARDATTELARQAEQEQRPLVTVRRIPPCELDEPTDPDILSTPELYTITTILTDDDGTYADQQTRLAVGALDAVSYLAQLHQDSPILPTLTTVRRHSETNTVLTEPDLWATAFQASQHSKSHAHLISAAADRLTPALHPIPGKPPTRQDYQAAAELWATAIAEPVPLTLVSELNGRYPAAAANHAKFPTWAQQAATRHSDSSQRQE